MTSGAPSGGTAAPSTLPEAGLDLAASLMAYRDWMVSQALIRTSGNKSEAAKLLKVKRTTLNEILRTASPVQLVQRPASSKRAPSEPPPSQAEPDTGVHERARPAAPVLIKRSTVAAFAAQGLNVRQIATELGCNRYMVEKILRELKDPPLAKCREKREP